MQVVADKTLEITQHLTESELRKHALHCKAADGFQRERVRLEEEQLKSEIEASQQRRRELTLYLEIEALSRDRRESPTAARTHACQHMLASFAAYADVC
jgi:hypothetical protein